MTHKLTSVKAEIKHDKSSFYVIYSFFNAQEQRQRYVWIRKDVCDRIDVYIMQQVYNKTRRPTIITPMLGYLRS